MTPRRVIETLCTSLLLLGYGLVPPSSARAQQPDLFGSSDDPQESVSLPWWQRKQRLDMMGGFSLIAAQWRSAANVTAVVHSRLLSFRLDGTFRSGIYGTYRPDVDEPYDLLRLLSYARLNFPPASGLYLRVGTLDRTRLGTGHLVDFFSSRVAWDARSVGLEMTWQSRILEVSAFSDNVLLDGVMGGRVAVRPAFWARPLPVRSLQLGFNYVTDRAPAGVRHLSGFNVDARFDAFRSGALLLSPFASVAWLGHYGYGLHFGADFHSPNFIDLARFRFRLALHYNGKQFVPGYFGSFYPVENLHARILDAAAFDRGEESQVGVALQDVRSGNDLVTEFRLLLFNRFELWYAFRRHYGPDPLSTYHLRLYIAARRLHLVLGQDRTGLRSFFTLFRNLGDQSALVFRVDYSLFLNFSVYVHARYSFERVSDDARGGAQYLVQRRFEPFSGLRFTF